MKFKSAIILAASLSLLAGNALAADNSHSQRYDKNSTKAKQHKVRKSSDEFARMVDMKHEERKRQAIHPVHQMHMGNR